ncbi:hypothetical protein DW322_11340 [Rhodococcus rhodnii]|uniref:Uncharacterized protein n=2 Tax=Rhodococcus rhodnii TaxID=38312 RepID=R7WRZ2_9NOCA|nr:hypothetical protein [Rhodococcus rhodnii]EOM78088.1 hypothetical protein Rrhod_0538 [Rhodococcus rhodnii LMG 5362]TXG90702.1 hypothetical protein DW322_11340 [Rhodococcus rhodnii]
MTILGYTPGQVAKALVAALTSVVALCTLAVATFTDGPLVQVGAYATAALLVLNPILVYAKAAAPILVGGDGDGRHSVAE